jgi:hypothetical protein
LLDDKEQVEISEDKEESLVSFFRQVVLSEHLIQEILDFMEEDLRELDNLKDEINKAIVS